MSRLARALAVAILCVAAGPFASTSGQQQPERTHPPALGPAPVLHLPPIQKRTLANGIPVWVVESHEVPLVQMDVLVRTGSSADPAGKFGLASLTAAMLDEGAGSRSALEIADAVDFVGAELEAGSGFDASAVRLNVPVAHLDAVLPVLADLVQRPTFPQAEIDRVRQERITSLLQARDDASSVATMAFSRVVFGPTYRYGTSAVGTPATLRGFTRADLVAFHASAFRPGTVAIVVAGDVRADDVVRRLDRQFGGWRVAGPPSQTIALAPAPQLTARTITIVDMPGAEQSQVRIGWIGAARSTPDYFTLQVLNTILGGSFSSRLNQNLREEHGYTYGARSSFDMRLSPGPFVAAAGIQTDKTADALHEFFVELTRIAQPVPADELTRAKNYVAFGFPSQFETIEELASHIEDLIVYGLPDDYFEQYVPKIEAVTAGDVQQAAAKYIRPDRFAIVIAGDRQKIEAPVRALGLGPVKVVSVSEAVGE